MTPSKSAQRPPAQPRFRSGAVARMAGMPVATLRIWEQRHQAVRPSTAASGHRLYSAADVERVTLLRRLTEQGHAIGLLAALDTDRMRQMLHAPVVAGVAKADERPLQAALKVVVVGQALAKRLQRWAERQPGGPALQCAVVFDSLADAVLGAQHSSAAEVDALLWQAPSLQPGAAQELRAAQAAWRAPGAAVVYRYGSAAVRAQLAEVGAAVFQEPAADEPLGLWLASLARPATQAGRAPQAPDWANPGARGEQAVSAPRFADVALTEFAGLSSALACECPSHLAQLLLQISSFETYSGDCAHKSAADAQLHAYLQRVAGSARMLFEAALEQVAIAEGLPLPESPAATSFSMPSAAPVAPAVS